MVKLSLKVAGSGKGFSSSHFIDNTKFKVRDVIK